VDAIIQDIVQSERFQEGLGKLSEELRKPPHRVERLAVRAFNEMVARHDPVTMAAYKGIGAALSRRYRIDVNHRALVRLRDLDHEHAIVWLPSHRSYLDMFYLEQVAHQAGIQPAYVLGGDNLDFWPIGPILRRAGILYIRRATHDDPVYRFALRSYLGCLVERGQNLSWSIEGGRSRTGKLRPPRYGALRYVADAVRHSEGPDAMVVPVSVVYEQLAEVAAMTAEARGGRKKPEGIGWLLQFARMQPGRMSTVRIDFGEPIEMRARIQELERDPRAKGQEVERLALEVCHRINRVTPAMPTAIVTLALLGAERALTLDETIEAMAPILSYLRDHPTTPHTLGAQIEDAGWVRSTLDQLTDSGVLTRFTGGDQTVWHISPEQHLVAAFYRNTLIHLLVNRAIAELALFMAREHPAGDLRASLWNNAIRLRQLLKFEFFFASRSAFLEEMLAELTLIDPEWEGRQVGQPVVTSERLELWLQRSKPHLAHLILRPFFDSYRVVADQLARWPHDREVDQEQLLERCLGFGQQQVLQAKLHSPESVTLELFRNGLKLAEHHSLLSGRGRDVHQRRRAFASDLRGIVDDLETLSRMQSHVVAPPAMP
jgi:glycerol-3-phosphate O-acyltransferase